jgi:HSP20 family protein
MAREIAVRQTHSILDEVAQIHEMIRRRAFEMFESRGDSSFGEMDDWLNAERELSLQPKLEIRRSDGRFEIEADLPGVNPKDLDVKVTGQDVLITAHRHETSGNGHAKGEVKPEVKENARAESFLKLFGAIHFPELIDPEAVKAEYRKGHLRLTAPVAKPKPAMTVNISA